MFYFLLPLWLTCQVQFALSSCLFRTCHFYWHEDHKNKMIEFVSRFGKHYDQHLIYSDFLPNYKQPYVMYIFIPPHDMLCMDQNAHYVIPANEVVSWWKKQICIHCIWFVGSLVVLMNM